MSMVEMWAMPVVDVGAMPVVDVGAVPVVEMMSVVPVVQVWPMSMVEMMSVPSPPPPPASSRIPSVHRIPSVQVYRGVVVLGECFLVYTLLESLRLHEEPPPHVSRLGTCSLHVGTLACS